MLILNKLRTSLNQNGVRKTAIKSKEYVESKIHLKIKKNETIKFDLEFGNNFNKSDLYLNNIKAILNFKESEKLSENKNIAIYSTFCGDSINNNTKYRKIESKYPHYFISNNKKILAKVEKLGWTPIFINIPISKNKVLSAHQAKIAKAAPHLFIDLLKYNYLVYIDDKMSIDDVKIESIIEYQKKNKYPIAARLHTSQPRNILIEFGESMLQNRYYSQHIQTSNYIIEKINHGYLLNPESFFLTGFIVRDMKNSEVLIFNENWYNEILKCGIECQISFNFVTQDKPIVFKVHE